MHTKVIPFDLNPKLLAPIMLLLIFMVYATQWAIQRALLWWLLLRRGIASLDFDTALTCDEESNELKKGTSHGRTIIESKHLRVSLK